jgi:hypothetical protein
MAIDHRHLQPPEGLSPPDGRLRGPDRSAPGGSQSSANPTAASARRPHPLSETGPRSTWGGEWLWSGVVAIVPRPPGDTWVLGLAVGGRAGRWVDRLGATPAARSLVDLHPWAGVAEAWGSWPEDWLSSGDGAAWPERDRRRSGDGLQGVGAELARGVEQRRASLRAIVSDARVCESQRALSAR